MKKISFMLNKLIRMSFGKKRDKLINKELFVILKSIKHFKLYIHKDTEILTNEEYIKVGKKISLITGLQDIEEVKIREIELKFLDDIFKDILKENIRDEQINQLEIYKILAYNCIRLNHKSKFIRTVLFLNKYYPKRIKIYAKWLVFFNRLFKDKISHLEMINECLCEHIITNDLLINQKVYQMNLSFGFYCKVFYEENLLNNISKYDFDFLLNLSLIRSKYQSLINKDYVRYLSILNTNNFKNSHIYILKKILDVKIKDLGVLAIFHSLRKQNDFIFFESFLLNDPSFNNLVLTINSNLSKRERIFFYNKYNYDLELLNFSMTKFFDDLQFQLFIKLNCMSIENENLASEFSKEIFRIVNNKQNLYERVEFWKSAFLKFLSLKNEFLNIKMDDFIFFIFTKYHSNNNFSFLKLSENKIRFFIYRIEKALKRKEWNLNLNSKFKKNYKFNSIEFDSQIYEFNKIINTVELLDLSPLCSQVFMIETNVFISNKNSYVAIFKKTKKETIFMGFIEISEYLVVFYESTLITDLCYMENIISLWISANRLNSKDLLLS